MQWNWFNFGCCVAGLMFPLVLGLTLGRGAADVVYAGVYGVALARIFPIFTRKPPLS